MENGAATIMTTDNALDMMMKILPDVAIIMNDTEAEKMISRLRRENAKDVEAGDAMQALVPLFASKYRKELYNIVAAFAGTTAENVAAQDIKMTISALTSGLTVTTGFFGCCLHMVRNM